MIEKFPEQLKNNNVTLTSLGFTNNFRPVEFKPSSNSSINVFKKPTECYTTTPCDKNDMRIIGGENFIKCECLKPTRSDFFGDTLKVVVRLQI
jgi:hypothetical protein